MLKKLLAGVLAALIAGSGAGATMTPEQEQQQADQIAKDYVKEYVSDMRAEMKKGDLENLKVSYSKCSAEVCGKEFDLSRRERADYIYYYQVGYGCEDLNKKYAIMTTRDGGLKEFVDIMRDLKELKYDVIDSHDIDDPYETEINDKTIQVYIDKDQFMPRIMVSDAESGTNYEMWSDYTGESLYVNKESVYHYTAPRDTFNSGTGYKNNKKDSSTSSNKKKYNYNSSSSSKHKYTYSDPYDAEDYDNADDYAEEWAEEFGDGDYDDGYDDAYEYWENAMD